MSEQPPDNEAKDLPSLDPAQFVGEPPAGDAQPGEFMSNDQSASPEDSTEDSTADESEDDQ